MAIAFLLAGGSGIRMGKPEPKQFLPLHDKEIWVHTTEVFQNAPEISEIIISCKPDYIERMQEGVARHGLNKVTQVVAGGKERHHSAFAGLRASTAPAEEKVLLCDIVRPCIPADVITRVVAALDLYSACDTGVPVTETLFEVEQERIVNVPDRSRFYLGQGPEGFHFALAYEALRVYLHSGQEGKTNISGIVTSVFPKVDLGFVLGAPENIKITTPHDLETARLILARQNRLN